MAESSERARRVAQAAALLKRVEEAVGRTLVGQHALVERMLIALLADGHLLIEGVPGLGKTLAVAALARALGLEFRRIQFTPDLLPADVIGTQIFRADRGDFSVKKGPLFAELVLADEINRAPPKVQSALLEAMQEKQVSIGGTTHPLGELFMCLATQNPIEHEGTYRLPEAQVDRFMMKVVIGYPSQQEEREIMDRQTIAAPAEVRRVATPKAVLDARAAVKQVHMEESLKDYIVRIVFATREPAQFGLEELRPLISFGVSPRASIFISLAARANAFLEGRDYVLPDDVKAVAIDVMRHRLIVTYQAEAEEVTPEVIITQVLDKVALP